MAALVVRRDQLDAELHRMVHDEAEDGTPTLDLSVTMRTIIGVLAHSSTAAIDLSIRSTPSIWIGHHDRSNNHLIRPHTWQ
jgi:hypothetical protein